MCGGMDGGMGGGMGYGGGYDGGYGGGGGDYDAMDGKGGGKGFVSKPGDWNCPACGDLQFARNTQCRRCGTLKPDGIGGGFQAPMGGGFQLQNRPGDWDCPNCGDHVFAKNNVCRRCGTTKPPEAGQAMSGGQVVTGGGFVLQNRPGDWNCPNCGDHVFAKNSTCRRCGAAKPEGTTQAVTGGPATVGGPGGSFVLQNRPGDWTCPNCGDHVFAKNDVCRRCGTVKTPDIPQATLPQQPGPFTAPTMVTQPAMVQQAQPGAVFAQPAVMDASQVGQQPVQQVMVQAVPGQEQPVQQVVMMPQTQQVMVDQYGNVIQQQMVVQQMVDQQGNIINVQGQNGGAQGGAVLAQQPQMGPQIGVQGRMMLENRPGDWSCPNCGDHVFARHAVCRRCGTANPNGTGGGGGVAAGGFQKPGDWVCPNCGDIVFGRNPSCRKCGNPKPEGQLDVFGNPAVAAGGGPPTKMPGDWLCSACGDHQFARNTSCRRCGAPRPDTAGAGGGMAAAMAMAGLPAGTVMGGARERSRSRDRGGN